ncbi:response regulator [Aquibacillus sediminis]|uniref:response regulator n=1 Tax=Aquibacillus sediminis TaxID=2574734 RepID=UPI001109F5F1|nr:response regulator [Aquibacillus sediminis]
MIKVLIVEDDQLVRKGLISAMPWKDYHMRVVGEASNGKKALEFLKENQVDLVFTDLNMPMMSGIEFMRTARKSYSDLFFVVLTIHQDFEYIQEALRLGAIDFITKVQLEKETFHKVLERISERLLEEMSLKKESFISTSFRVDSGIAVYMEKEMVNQSWINDKELKLQCDIQQMDDKILFCTPNQDLILDDLYQLLNRKLNGRPWLVKIVGIKDQYINKVHQLLVAYHDTLLFYGNSEEHVIHFRKLNELVKDNRMSYPDTYQFKKLLCSFEWVFKEEKFAKMIEEIRNRKIPQDSLHQLLNEMVDEWNNKYVFSSSSEMSHPGSFYSWKEVERWLDNFRHMTKVTKETNYASDVIDSILVAVRLIQDNLGEAITAADVASQVSMSRSYFNKCFKDIVGRSFHQYLREMRIEKAKGLLRDTNESIYWIAEKMGYLDEKYFSKIFREQTGMLPSQYRRNLKRRKEEQSK